MYERTSNNDFLKDFFEKMSELYLAITFADVKMKTLHSDIMPDDANVNSYFSRNIPLKVPIVSAAMDTVTEGRAAIAMAEFGGIGVIHRGLSIEEQARQVKKVKSYMNGFISTPVSLLPSKTLKDVQKILDDNEGNFKTFPVVDESNRLLGVLTRTDIDFSENLDMKVSQCMTKEVICGDEETDLQKAYDLMKNNKIKFLPLVNKEDMLLGVYTLKDIKRVLNSEKVSCNIDENGQLRVAAAIGINDYERAQVLLKNGVDALVIDTAHGDTKAMLETIGQLKKLYDNVDVVAGNISESDGIEDLIISGADAIKVGQGPGSICTTRIIAGVGKPQLSAIYDCAIEAQRIDNTVPIIADGGIQYSGDIPMAIGVGAASVMLGSLLAGTDESPGGIITFEGKQYKTYRGMGSLEAMTDSDASRKRYGQKATTKDAIVPEGIEGLSSYKGSLHNVLVQYKVGLQRAMGYLGAKNIHELQEKIKFHRLTMSGVNESHPHDITAIKGAPNYSK